MDKRGVYAGRRSTKIHVALYRRSGGRVGRVLPGWPDARIALVDHTGAKSGRKRTSPVIYHEYGDAIVVIAVPVPVPETGRRFLQRPSGRVTIITADLSPSFC
jgi:hypothetical protein